MARLDRLGPAAKEVAQQPSANLEAEAHLKAGLELTKTLPETELALRIALAVPLIATRGYPAKDLEETYLGAGTLAEALGRDAELFTVWRGLWNCYICLGNQPGHPREGHM